MSNLEVVMPLTSEQQKVKEALILQASPDELLDQLLEALEPADLKILYESIFKTYQAEPVTNKLARKLQTKEFSTKERVELQFATLLKYFDHRRKLLESSLNPTQVAKLLNVTRQTAHDRREAGTMIGVLDNGVWRYPIWQFDPEGPNGVVDGLPDILKALKVSQLAKVNWLTRKNPVLNSTPIEALKNKRKSEVLAEALSVGVV